MNAHEKLSYSSMQCGQKNRGYFAIVLQFADKLENFCVDSEQIHCARNISAIQRVSLLFTTASFHRLIVMFLLAY